MQLHHSMHQCYTMLSQAPKQLIHSNTVKCFGHTGMRQGIVLSYRSICLCLIQYIVSYVCLQHMIQINLEADRLDQTTFIINETPQGPIRGRGGGGGGGFRGGRNGGIGPG